MKITALITHLGCTGRRVLRGHRAGTGAPRTPVAGAGEGGRRGDRPGLTDRACTGARAGTGSMRVLAWAQSGSRRGSRSRRTEWSDRLMQGLQLQRRGCRWAGRGRGRMLVAGGERAGLRAAAPARKGRTEDRECRRRQGLQGLQLLQGRDRSGRAREEECMQGTRPMR